MYFPTDYSLGQYLPKCWSDFVLRPDGGRTLARMPGDDTTGMVTVTLAEGGPIPARVTALTVTKYRVLGSKSVTCKYHIFVIHQHI